eukprot:CAMPEP_0178437758 /NCGR_PEP_ID=MMETSP0689_2-20121128/35183_1 /TAXON_ID=160604 /ORGANISM="Amphidinium massartii, Strain CS-259" /LENGTH=37 /DNA_ID= /DNA_START= /DNA_END= /DNA_ORIENTATION=
MGVKVANGTPSRCHFVDLREVDECEAAKDETTRQEAT